MVDGYVFEKYHIYALSCVNAFIWSWHVLVALLCLICGWIASLLNIWGQKLIWHHECLALLLYLMEGHKFLFVAKTFHVPMINLKMKCKMLGKCAPMCSEHGLICHLFGVWFWWFMTTWSLGLTILFEHVFVDISSSQGCKKTPCKNAKTKGQNRARIHTETLYPTLSLNSYRDAPRRSLQHRMIRCLGQGIASVYPTVCWKLTVPTWTRGLQHRMIRRSVGA
jgi:hypothetical protein